MRLLLDEDSQSRLVVRLLREAGHDVLTVSEAALEGREDADVFACARREGRVLLTRNGRDFQMLHEAEPDHPGVLVEYQDQDPAKNLSAARIVQAIDNLATSGWSLSGQLIALNAWAFPPHARGHD